MTPSSDLQGQNTLGIYIYIHIIKNKSEKKRPNHTVEKNELEKDVHR